jgi:hypothetical protein
MGVSKMSSTTLKAVLLDAEELQAQAENVLAFHFSEFIIFT